MNDCMLFIDGSVNPRSKIGYGAYLAVPDSGLSLDRLKDQVNVKQFVDTSSTKLELQNLLWALKEVAILGRKVTIYTDSQNSISLLDRREKLEKNNYYSSKNKRLNNYELYQAFYETIDKFECQFVKIKGHKKSSQKNDIDKIFALVDKASRQALRRAEATLTF